MMIRTDTREYVNSHGHEPHGTGLWLFQATGTDGMGAWTDLGVIEVNTSYGKARTEAVRQARRKASTIARIAMAVLTVLP